MRIFLRTAATAAILAILSGCGYTLQTSENPLAEKEGIRRIYVDPLVNNTYKAGIENTVYNALIRTLSVHRRVILVSRPEEADAILKGSVDNAVYGPSATGSADTINPASPAPQSIGTGDIRANIQIATEYSATLSCSFSLVRPHPGPQQKAIVWSGSFNRSKLFEASNNLGVQGDTSALINESEFDRALSDIATSMMDDVHESMLAMF